MFDKELKNNEEMRKEQIDIIEISAYAEALRSTGYKDIESAMSEVVDNAVEANSKNIYVIFEEKCNPGERNKVENIYFLDDGTGMDIDTLQKCLVLGSGTKKNRKGIGRFGVGLPQSSMYATPSVDVYSWEDGYKNAYKSYLNVSKLVSGEQTGFIVPEKCDLPKKIVEKYIEQDINNNNHSFKKHGTLVVWKNCDNVKPQTYTALRKRLEFELGRRFRYLIQNNARRILIINDVDYLNSNGCFELIPNDPCFLMEKNYIMGDVERPGKWVKERGVPIFEPFEENHEGGVWEIEIDYIDRNDNQRKKAPVSLKSSVVKKEFYDQDAFPGKDPGSYELGKQVKKLQGISIVRAGREIDFGSFGFFNPNDKYTDRWWSLEINFDPILDEVFGVSNNKQHVELIEIHDDYVDYEDKDNPIPLWTQLKHTIEKEITAMSKRNKQFRAGSRKKKDPSDSEETINTTENENKIEVETNSNKEREQSTQEQIDESAKNVAVIKGINEEDIDCDVIKTITNNKVNIVYEATGDYNPFFEYRCKHGIVECVFNINHEFYKKFMSSMINDSNKKNKNCVELIFGSLVRLFDETTDDELQKIYQKLVKKWNAKVEDYLSNLDD